MIIDTSIIVISVGLLATKAMQLQARQTSSASWLFMLSLFAYHTGFCFLYYQMIKTMPADANMYFRVGSEYATGLAGAVPFEPGTKFILWIVANVQSLFSLQKVTLFLLFSFSGFLGLLYLYFAVLPYSKHRNGTLLLLVLFLPGLSFWTSALGKDSLIFLPLCYLLYGLTFKPLPMLKLAMAIGLVMMIRPHVGMVILLCLGIAALIDGQQITKGTKVMLTGIMAAALLALLPFVLSFVGLSELSVEAISEKMETQSEHNQEGGGALDITQLSLPGQIFAYLFRPLFFDAKNMLGLVVSGENLLYLCMFASMCNRNFVGFFKQHKGLLLWFAVFYFALMTLMMATTTANSGIAIRQKLMYFPFLIYVFMRFNAFQAARNLPPMDVVGVTKKCAG